jgi:hypothetical protein
MHIQTFDTDEEMFKAMDDARQAADSRVLSWQSKVKPGDYYLRFLPDEGLIVYGEIKDRLEGAEPDELEYLKELDSQPHMRNYRFGRHYSAACEDGELGDVHVSSIGMLLTRKEFERAREKHWPIEGPGTAWNRFVQHSDRDLLEQEVREFLAR